MIIKCHLFSLNLSMTSFTVTIKNKKALKALEALRANDLIDFTKKTSSRKRQIKKEKIQTHFASEKILAKDWLTKKEDAAWQDL